MASILSVLNLVLCLGLAVGGLAAFRHGFARTANEVQERVINALESEINALKDRLGELEKENARLTQVIATIRMAMRRRGLLVTIDGELVSIRDRAGKFTQATRIQSSQLTEEEL
jgi:YD repeat-containing protein